MNKREQSREEWEQEFRDSQKTYQYDHTGFSNPMLARRAAESIGTKNQTPLKPKQFFVVFFGAVFIALGVLFLLSR